MCACGLPAEMWSSAERFRGVCTSGTGPTQSDFGQATPGRMTHRSAQSGRIEERDGMLSSAINGQVGGDLAEDRCELEAVP